MRTRLEENDIIFNPYKSEFINYTDPYIYRFWQYMLPELFLTVNVNLTKSTIRFAYELNIDSNDLVNGLRRRLAFP